MSSYHNLPSVKEYKRLVNADPYHKILKHYEEQGYGWGRAMEKIQEMMDAEKYKGETAAQKNARVAEEIAKTEEERKKENAKAHVMRKTARFMDPKTGTLTKRIASVCKHAFDTAKDGFPAGCASHAVQRCPWFHPGEPGYDAVCSGKARGPVRENRNYYQERVSSLKNTRKANRGKTGRKNTRGKNGTREKNNR